MSVELNNHGTAAGNRTELKAGQRRSTGEKAGIPKLITEISQNSPATIHRLDTADPIKHPELISGSYDYALPGVITGIFPERAYSEIAELSQRASQGQAIKWRREIESKNGTEVFNMVFYPKGFPRHPESIKIMQKYELKKQTIYRKREKYISKKTFRQDTAEYTNDPVFRESHLIPEVEAVVAIGASHSEEEFRRRFFSVVHGASERELAYRQFGLRHCGEWKDGVMLVYDAKNRPVATAESLDTFNPDYPDTAMRGARRELSFDVHSKQRRKSIASTLARDLTGIAQANGDREVFVEYLPDNPGMRQTFFGIKKLADAGELPIENVRIRRSDDVSEFSAQLRKAETKSGN